MKTSGASILTPLSVALTQGLQALLGPRFSASRAVCDQHGRDESIFELMSPQAVVYPETTEEVVEIVRLCKAHGSPIIPYGAGSSLEGHTLALHGGVTVNMQKMNRILEIHSADLMATVEPGVTRIELNAAVRDQGLFFPIDPGANASLGGMCATRASGTNAVRFGTMRENVVNLTVVMASGEVLRTTRRARKSSAGLDLTRLFVGSEGTLGIITEVTVKLYPLPETVMAAVCHFPSIDQAVTAVITMMQLGIPLARVEFVDSVALRAINAHSKTNMKESPHLFFEFHGDEVSVPSQIELMREIADEAGGAEFVWADTPEARTRLWNARHNAYFAGMQLRPGCRSIVTDVCVPISRLAECVAETVQDLARSGILAPIVGHVGDGNFHVQMLVDPNSPEEIDNAERLHQRLIARTLAADGTCTGEHGIGLHKQQYLIDEVGVQGVAAMRAIKHALDPGNLFNPGKIMAFEAD